MKCIGILGGMGPEATADLFWRIVRLVPARRDQDHPRVLVDSRSDIPDRTRAIRGEGESPLPLLVATARALEQAGADVIVMPCNSAHHWIAELAASVRIPFLDMIQLTARAAARDAGAGPVLVLATSGTVTSGVYHRAFESQGLPVSVPEPAEQERLMEAIYLVKAGEHARARPLAMDVAFRALRRTKATAAVLGCTELPLVLKAGDLPVPVIDSTDVLARAAVEFAAGAP